MNFDYEPTHRSISDGSDIMIMTAPPGWAWAFNENGDFFPVELSEWEAV